MIRPWFGLVFLAIFFSVVAAAQTPKLEPGNSYPDIPTVTFTLDWPQARPPYYSIAVDSAGRAAYTGVDDARSGGEPYMEKFEVSRSVRDRIFAAAEALDHFQGQYDFKRHKVAFTGNKTLAYAGPKHKYSTTYNWSENPQVADLTQLFLGIGNTINGGRRLAYLHRFDRLGLNDELKDLESAAKEHYLVELHVISPVLHKIAEDPAVMDLARQRAQHLLSLAAAEQLAAQAPARPPKPAGNSH